MEAKGALGTLFDMSFSDFITIKMIKLIYVLGIILAGIGTLTLIAGGFSQGVGRGLIILILSPIPFLIYVLLARIWCEMIIVVFRIAENTSRMANNASPQVTPPPPATPGTL